MGRYWCFFILAFSKLTVVNMYLKDHFGSSSGSRSQIISALPAPHRNTGFLRGILVMILAMVVVGDSMFGRVSGCTVFVGDSSLDRLMQFHLFYYDTVVQVSMF